jgi:hypothetical protein
MWNEAAASCELTKVPVPAISTERTSSVQAFLMEHPPSDLRLATAGGQPPVNTIYAGCLLSVLSRDGEFGKDRRIA